MMRLVCATWLAISFTAHAHCQQVPAQGNVPAAQRSPQAEIAAREQLARQQMAERTAQMKQQQAAMAKAQGLPVPGNPAAVPNEATQQPFPNPAPEAQAQLQKILQAWEHNSKGTKTLECKFQRWHYDLFAAPAGVHATKADGVIRYAAPDKGKFKVEGVVFFNGFVAEKPTYKAQPGQYGEHWVCDGEKLIEFDYSKKECHVQTLPPHMRGKQIFNSPLPFVFNLDAARIQQRYWVRQVAAPKPGIVLIEAWPKTQADRSQYKMVQVALNTSTYLPEALIMYAPNFHSKKNPKWDHYEFSDMKRNAIAHGLAEFFKKFLDKPPSDWKVIQENFMAPPQQEVAEQGQPQRG